MEEKSYFEEVFKNASQNQKLVVVCHDKIFTKKSYQFHGGKVFGMAKNEADIEAKIKEDERKALVAWSKRDSKGESKKGTKTADPFLASTGLGIMVNGLQGGPSFVSKIIPVNYPTGEFVDEVVGTTVDALESPEVGCEVVAIVCDGNKVNSRFFKLNQESEAYPWRSKMNKDGTRQFLTYDQNHLFKNIRNSWITEKRVPKYSVTQFLTNGVKSVNGNVLK